MLHGVIEYKVWGGQEHGTCNESWADIRVYGNAREGLELESGLGLHGAIVMQDFFGENIAS